ncbi:MAG: PspC domain-containing protein [Clostridiales bacterium]|nr:PspC domain-containing protein [Clostridiales bacterium]
MKKLKRSVNNRMISGICGGIGEYAEIDPTIIRILWVIGAFISFGAAVLIYIILIFIIPPDDGIIDI